MQSCSTWHLRHCVITSYSIHYTKLYDLYASAVLAVGLIALVALLAMTALLWGMGLQPVFTH